MLRTGRISTLAIAAVCAASLVRIGPAEAGSGRGLAIGIGAGIIGGVLLGEAMRNQQAQQRPQAAPRSYRRSTERAESSSPSSSRSSKRASKKSSEPEPAAARESDLSKKEVADAQRALNILGFEAGTESSGQGPKFERAVKAFQGLIAEPKSGKLSRLQLAELQRRADAAEQPKLAEPKVEGSVVATALADPAPSRSSVAPEVRTTGPTPAATKVNYEEATQRFHRIMEMGQDRIGRFFYVEKSEIGNTGRIKVTVRKTVVSTDMSRPLPESRELSGSVHNLIAVHDTQDPTLAHLMYYQPDQNRSLVLFTVGLQETDATRAWAESLQRDIDQIAEIHGDISDPYNNLKKLRRTELARR